MSSKSVNAQINKYILVFAAIISLGVQLFVFSQQQIHEVATKILIVLLGVVSYLISIMSGRVRKRAEYKFAHRYTIVMIIITTFFVFYTKRLYGYTLYQAFASGAPYYYILFTPCIVQILIDEKRRKYMLNYLLKITLFFIAVRALAWFFYNYTSIPLFNNFATEYDGWVRNGRARLIGGSLFGLAFILLVSKVTDRGHIKSRRKRSIDTLLVIFMISYCAIVSATRYASAVMIVTFMVALFFTRHDTASKMGIFLLIVGCLAVLLMGGFAGSMLSSFTVEGTYGLSTLARLDGLEHFAKLFKTVGNNFGLGLALDGYTTENLFYRTSWLRYYLGDLGIVGAYFRFGIFVIPIFGWLFYEGIKVCIASQRMRSKNSGLLIALTCYIVLSCIGSNIYEPTTAFAVPFYVAIISHEKGRLKTQKLGVEVINNRYYCSCS